MYLTISYMYIVGFMDGLSYCRAISGMNNLERHIDHCYIVIYRNIETFVGGGGVQKSNGICSYGTV